MEKLQLYMFMKQSAYKEMLLCNPDNDTKAWIDDITEAVCQVEYPLAQPSIFYLVKYIDAGVFITVIRTIPSVIGNHLASWIYVPYTLSISDRDLRDTVAFVASVVSKPEVTAADVQSLRQHFEREYPDSDQRAYFPPCDGNAYAYRYYGPRVGSSIADLIGPYRYQLPYLNFAGVLLVDENLTTDVTGTNLTSAQLEPMAVLFPPEVPQGCDYQPKIYGQPFDVPFFVPIGKNAEVKWVSPNASHPSQVQNVYVSQDRMRTPSPSMRQPQPQAPRPAPQPQQPIQPQQPVHGEAPPAQPAAPKKRTYHFEIPSKSSAIGSLIEFDVTTHVDLDCSPIDGYEPTGEVREGMGRVNQLRYKSESLKEKLLSRGIYAVAGFILGVLVTLLCTCGGGHPAKPEPAANPNRAQEIADSAARADSVAAAAETLARLQKEQALKDAQQQGANAPSAAAEDVSLAAAIKYLDANTTWKKAEMEKYPDLRGLFADLNNINRDKIIDTWAPKLADSRQFATVNKHIVLGKKKTPRKKPFRDAAQPQEMHVQSYLNNVDP